MDYIKTRHIADKLLLLVSRDCRTGIKNLNWCKVGRHQSLRIELLPHGSKRCTPARKLLAVPVPSAIVRSKILGRIYFCDCRTVSDCSRSKIVAKKRKQNHSHLLFILLHILSILFYKLMDFFCLL